MSRYDMDEMELGERVAGSLELENLQVLLVRRPMSSLLQRTMDWYKRAYFRGAA